MGLLIQHISARDNGHFAHWFVKGTLEERGHQDKVENTDEIVAILRYHMLRLPEMFQLMSGRDDVALFLSDAERAVLATNADEGLYGLLGGLLRVGSALRWCRDQGLTLPEGLAIDTAVELAGILLGDYRVALLQRRLDIAGLGSGFDERLLGTWHHSRYYASDDFSHVSTVSRVLGATDATSKGRSRLSAWFIEAAQARRSGRIWNRACRLRSGGDGKQEAIRLCWKPTTAGAGTWRWRFMRPPFC